MEFIPGKDTNPCTPSFDPSTLPTPPVTPRPSRDTLEEDILMVNHTHIATEMAHNFVEQNGKMDIMLLDKFKRHTALFLDEEAKLFPPSQPWDHKIELKDEAPDKFNCKMYPLSLKEQRAEDKFIDKNLEKGYIMPSDSLYGFPTFLVPKKDLEEM